MLTSDTLSDICAGTPAARARCRVKLRRNCATDSSSGTCDGIEPNSRPSSRCISLNCGAGEANFGFVVVLSVMTRRQRLDVVAQLRSHNVSVCGPWARVPLPSRMWKALMGKLEAELLSLPLPAELVMMHI